LIEGIEVPDNSLSENAVLIKGYELA
jgi:hypothetical protein